MLLGKYSYNNKEFMLVDLPGTYSLMSNSDEEEIARDYICFGNPDCTIVVVDATSLERNLNLVYQTLEITPNTVVCVNLLDEAKKKKIKIDLTLLSEALGVPVVGTTARKPKTLKKLQETVYNVCSKKNTSKPKTAKYIPIIEYSILSLLPEINKIYKESYLSRWLALKIIDSDEKIISSIENKLNINIKENKIITEKLQETYETLSKNNIPKDSFKDKIVSSIVFKCEDVCKNVCSFENRDYNSRDKKIDKVLTSKTFGIPIMLLFLGVIFWLTITGANYPSSYLSHLFRVLQEKLLLLFDTLGSPEWIKNLLVLGMYQTTSWVVAVMLPPMAIFFPLFTILEDLGYLPRISFNLDNLFKKACTTGKQALTMCMGFGCNAAGIVGARIIDSPREKLIAILTNSFVPCNGRFPFLITIATIFIGSFFTGVTGSIISTLCVLVVIVLGIFMTLLISKVLSKTILKGMPSSYILELPPYRKPQIGKVIVRSIFDRTLFVLGRAVAIAAPAGIVIWLFSNVTINGLSLLTHIANLLNPFALLLGLDGYILTAFILALPANEIVLPIILMSYMGAGTLVSLEDTNIIGNILLQNGWTMLTAINVMLFTLLHFPCSTTLLTIKKETSSWKWSAASFIIPTVCGIVVCMATTFVWNLFV